MAKVRDEKGREIEGRSVVTESQAKARENREAHIQEQREALTVRQEQRAKRGPREQLVLLDKRLGVGQGAKKERARLEAML